MMRRLFMLTVFIVVSLLAGCATLPPVKAVQEFKQVAGKWEGWATIRRSSFPVTLTIREDGSYESSGADRTFTGVMQISEGKIRWKHTSGETGTWSLYEGEGRRLLKSVRDDGILSAEYTPVE